ncbi:phosphatidylinositol 5-phosphate 4-kinase type-2 gamma-like [Scyliorhinus torazame]|uniref:phosphatidylinositol 5-phosphate 4-kinase type-2 gamma-like n=1 Tax=Scyliorhinus torazame TaxID=75743 RepID=UPI003B5B7CB5
MLRLPEDWSLLLSPRQFLTNLKIMDYSLLLGIHDTQRLDEEEELSVHFNDVENGTNNLLTPFYGQSPDMQSNNMMKVPVLAEYDPFTDVYAVRSAEGSPRKEVYFMGLIDILTQYDTKKKAAHAAKTVKHGAGAEISTVNPEQYGKRFMDFITNIFA